MDNYGGGNKMMFEHGRLVNADAMEIMGQLADDSVDMIFADPPYRTVSGGNNHQHRQQIMVGTAGHSLKTMVRFSNTTT